MLVDKRLLVQADKFSMHIYTDKLCERCAPVFPDKLPEMIRMSMLLELHFLERV